MGNVVGFRFELYDFDEPPGSLMKDHMPTKATRRAWIPQTVADQVWALFEFETQHDRNEWVATLPDIIRNSIDPDLPKAAEKYGWHVRDMNGFEIEDHPHEWPDGDKLVKELGRLVQSKLPKGIHFFLNIATIGEGGFNAYVSNIERESVVGLIVELLQRLGYYSPPVAIDLQPDTSAQVFMDQIIERSGIEVGQSFSITRDMVQASPKYAITSDLDEKSGTLKITRTK